MVAQALVNDPDADIRTLRFRHITLHSSPPVDAVGYQSAKVIKKGTQNLNLQVLF